MDTKTGIDQSESEAHRDKFPQVRDGVPELVGRLLKHEDRSVIQGAFFDEIEVELLQWILIGFEIPSDCLIQSGVVDDAADVVTAGYFREDGHAPRARQKGQLSDAFCTDVGPPSVRFRLVP